MSSTIELRYGKGTLPVALPSGVSATIIRKPKMPLVADPESATLKALRAPINCAPLAEYARGKKSACIAICDITRPVPNHLFLRPIIETLIRAGITQQNIAVLVATGLHRPNEGSELTELIGDPWVLENVRVENHFARRDADHVH